MVTVPLSWTYTTLYCPVRGLFTIGSIPIVIWSSRAPCWYSCGILLRFSLLFLMIIIFSFSQSIFVSSCHTTVLVRTYLVGTSIEIVEATGVMWCTPERVGYQDEDLFPWVLDLEFTLLNSSKFHNAFLSTHTLLCHY